MKRLVKKSISIVTAVIFSLFFTAAANAQKQLVPVGRAVGIQLYTDGLLVIGSSEIGSRNIANECGIKNGDRITAVNGKELSNSDELSDEINTNPENISLEITRDDRHMTVNAVPAQCDDGIYRLGLWLRDSCAGVGTVTYYDPESNEYAALGHAVNDVDTGNILSVKSGNILDCNIVSVTKSSRGIPGEINAVFGDTIIGNIGANTYEGIFGRVENNACLTGKSLEVAKSAEVHKGDAYIVSDILGGSPERYSIRIKKITDEADKGIELEVNDSRLIDLAGGIVQGMSGSPIIQDDKLVGAITHVLVDNPLNGYGTLAESMLQMQEKCI